MNVNPYQPPETSGNRPVASPRTVSRKPLLAVAFGTVAYHIFVSLLLQSTPVDQEAGRLLLLNTPMFAAWGLATLIRSQHSTTFGLAACGMQYAIAAIMIVRSIGDWQAIVLINGIILAVLVAITGLCWKCRRGKDTVTDPVSEVTREIHTRRDS